jgi:hypothetical protein
MAGSKVEADDGTVAEMGGISGKTMFALGSGENAETSDGESRRLSVGKGVCRTRGGLGVLSTALEGASEGNAAGAGAGICRSTGSGRAGLGATSWKKVVSTRNKNEHKPLPVPGYELPHDPTFSQFLHIAVRFVLKGKACQNIKPEGLCCP